MRAYLDTLVGRSDKPRCKHNRLSITSCLTPPPEGVFVLSKIRYFCIVFLDILGALGGGVNQILWTNDFVDVWASTSQKLAFAQIAALSITVPIADFAVIFAKNHQQTTE